MPAAKRERRSTIVLYAALALLLLISATYRALDITERVGDLRHGAEYARDPFDIDLPGWELEGVEPEAAAAGLRRGDRKSTRLNSSHSQISYAVFCLKKKKKTIRDHIK